MAVSPKKNTSKKKRAALSGFTKSQQSWKPRARPAKMVGEFVPGLMRPAFEKFGFSATTLLTDWEAIAGASMAAYTAPERLKWPRKSPEDCEGAGKGATLILRVAGARALEVEQSRPQLIERINAAFGYRAVSEIRIIQAPLRRMKIAPPPSQPKAAISADEMPLNLPEGPMKDALARIARGVKARQRQAQNPAS